MKEKIKNIIFDLNGVMFKYSTKSEFIKLKNGIIINPIIPIKTSTNFLKELHDQKDSKGTRMYALFACTNWKDSVIEFLENHYNSIVQLFDAIVTPDKSKAKKPEPKMFEFLLASYNLKPNECLFLDDHLENVLAAKNHGLEAILIDNPEILPTKVKEILLNPA